MSLFGCLFGHKWDSCNAKCVRCGEWNPRLEEAREAWENRDTEPLSEEEWNEMFTE